MRSCSDHISLPGRCWSLKSELCILQLFVIVTDIMDAPLLPASTRMLWIFMLLQCCTLWFIFCKVFCLAANRSNAVIYFVVYFCSYCCNWISSILSAVPGAVSKQKKGIPWNAQEAQSNWLHKPLTWALKPGGGEELCAEGHLPYALRVRPQTKARQMQAGQPARQPDPPQRGGGEQSLRGRGCVCRRVFLCVCCFLNEDKVALATTG